MSSEGPYGRQGFQSNPSGYGGQGGGGSYGNPPPGGGGYAAPQYGGGGGYGGASYSAPSAQGGAYGAYGGADLDVQVRLLFSFEIKRLGHYEVVLDFLVPDSFYFLGLRLGREECTELVCPFINIGTLIEPEKIFDLIYFSLNAFIIILEREVGRSENKGRKEKFCVAGFEPECLHLGWILLCFSIRLLHVVGRGLLLSDDLRCHGKNVWLWNLKCKNLEKPQSYWGFCQESATLLSCFLLQINVNLAP